MTTATEPIKGTRLAADLRTKIRNGRLKAGDALPTQRELSRAYGIAESTAYLAMTRLVHEGLVVRVRGRGSFVKDAKPATPLTIDFIRPLENPGERRRLAVMELIETFASACAERERRAVWHHRLSSELAQPEKLVEELASAQVAVVLFAPLDFSRALHRRGIAVVSIMPRPPYAAGPLREPFPVFDLDRRAITVGAFEHLLGLGYRRIAWAGRPSTANRTDTFLACLHRHGLHGSTEWIRTTPNDDCSDLRPWIEQLMRDDPRPEAICCATEHVAACVEQFLLDLNVRVPRDIALVAADDGPEARIAPVPITTFGVDYPQAARLVVQTAEKCQAPADPANGPGMDAILLPMHLTVRASCGAKPADAT